MSLTVGIDLGTTYSVIAYIDPSTKKPIIIKNRYGNSTTPSAIGIIRMFIQQKKHLITT